MQNRTPPLNLKVKGAFQHADSCANQQTMDWVIKLIRKDADHHHLFFNDKGFHNHLVHQLLADYSLGADRPRLEKAYDDNALYQRPKKPPKSDFVWNSLQCLGNEDYYTSYLNFFQEEVQKKGMKHCIEYYIFEQDPKLGWYARFLAGVYHPMIHLGYGIEFNLPLMVAEGLAWIAVHKPRSSHFFESVNKIAQESLSGKTHSSLTALEIILSVHQDSRLNEIVQWVDEDKYTTVINKASDLLQEYCQQWPVSASLDGKNGLRERATELQILAASMYAGSYRSGDETMLDFFLMHTLTSSLFLHCYVELLDPHYGATLLRGKFAADIVWYIAHGRPQLNIEQFMAYPALLDWDHIISKAIASEDDHVPKAVRALIHASHYDKQILSPQIYQAMASLTVNENLFWTLDAIGFDEARYGDKKNQQAKTRVIHV